MAANEIANALHAGGVFELGPTQADCQIYGQWGIREIVEQNGVQPGAWLLVLDEPIYFQASPEVSAGLALVSHWVSKNSVLTATLGTTTHPVEAYRGNILIQQTAAGVGDPTTVVLSLLVARIPAIP